MAQATPRSNPNYAVHLADATIRSLVHCSLPAVAPQQLVIESLPSGKSFNNRIYYIHLTAPTKLVRPRWTSDRVEILHNGPHIEAESLVLKIAGRPFGATKIQNEVAGLFLLEKYSPSVPVPRVAAWSEDGHTIKTLAHPGGVTDRNCSAPHDQPLGLDDAGVRSSCADQGWIFMTRVPGRIIDHEDLAGTQGDAIMTQIATHMAAWRTSLPPGRAIGNVRLVESGSHPPTSAVLYDRALLPGLDAYIGGLLVTESPSHPLTSPRDYFEHLFDAELRRLQASQLYVRNQRTVPHLVAQFLRSTFPRLSLVSKKADPTVFTHYDISPRNILVRATGPPALVTAIVDLEFAGFFPALEEFANIKLHNLTEWTDVRYNVLLAALDKLCALPASLAKARSSSSSSASATATLAGGDATGTGRTEFLQTVLLLRLVGNIAPWWVKEESALSEHELARELDAARATVEEAVQALEHLVATGADQG